MRHARIIVAALLLVAGHALADPSATGRQTVSNASSLPATARDVDGTSVSRTVKDRFEHLVDHTAGWLNVGGSYGLTGAALATAQADAASKGVGLLIAHPIVISTAVGTVSVPVRFEGGGKLVLNTGGSVTLTGAMTAPLTQVFDLPGGGTLTFSAKVREVVPQWWGAKGDGATDDVAAIQSAVAATPEGGVLALGSGVFKVKTGLPLVLRKPITIAGAGGLRVGSAAGNAVIAVDDLVGAATDIILVQPTVADEHAYTFRDFNIGTSIGIKPGRYGIHVDGASTTIANLVVERVQIQQLGSFAIRADGTGLGQGTPTMSTIRDSYLIGGISMPTAGDTVRVRDCRINGLGPALDVSFQPGASTLLFTGNNVQSLGGVHIGGSAIAAQIVENELETLPAFTGSNGALLDVDGTSGAHALDVIVERNSFQVVNGITAQGVRINYSDRAYIAGNRFGRGAGASKDVQVTANASDTYIGHNIFVGGWPASAMVSDAGTRTLAMYGFPGAPGGSITLSNGQWLGWVDDSGNNLRNVLRTATDGTVSLNGYHASAFLVGSNGTNFLYDPAGAVVASLAGGMSISQAFHPPTPAGATQTSGIFMGSAAPVAGTFTKGDVVINNNPAVGSPKGWRCTVAGSPGTWVSEGNL